MLYSDVRSQIKSGDLLAFSHYGWKTWKDIKSQAVRMFTQSEYSHVGVAWVTSGRVLCLEAVIPLVRIYPLSKLGSFYWMPTPRDYWNADVEEFALSIVGEPYSQWKAIEAFFGTPKANHMWQCCEYVHAVMAKGGYDMGNIITPTGIVKSAQSQDFPFHFIENGKHD